MAYRGLYHQPEGNEHNPNAFAEHMADSEVIEGPIVKRLHDMYKRLDWKGITELTKQLEREKWAGYRINSMLTRASVGARLPQKSRF